MNYRRYLFLTLAIAILGSPVFAQSAATKPKTSADPTAEQVDEARKKRLMPKPLDTTEQNTTRFRTAGVPSFGGFGTARAMARIYAALANGGEIDGVRLLSPEALAQARSDWADMGYYGT